MPAVLTLIWKSTSEAELSGKTIVTHAPEVVGVMEGVPAARGYEVFPRS